MAVTKIAHKPELTIESAREIFAKHFGQNKIEDWKGIKIGNRSGFMVVKNPFVAVTVRLEQTENETKFVYAGLAPRLWARLISAGLLVMFFWGRFVSEVRHFIEEAPEFK